MVDYHYDADKWYQEHEKHVKSLLWGYIGDGYPPTGSDLFHPELWKVPHWRWFIKERLA